MNRAFTKKTNLNEEIQNANSIQSYKNTFMLIKKHLQMILACALTLLVAQSYGQEAPVNLIDTLTTKMEGVESDLSQLKKIKFSGYVQAQWQKADTIGSPSVAGGNFTGFDNRIQVRRARFKAAYSGANTTVAVQFDLKDDGTVKVKEAYGTYTEPVLKTFSLTGGIFNRPIGFEVEYSSSLLESPERSRILQTLFPDECDMGAKLTIQAPKTSPLNFIKLDVGLFNGNAIFSETDKYKDIIAHLSLKKSFMDENLSVGGGLSYYNGGWAAQSNNIYKLSSDTAFVLDPSYKIGSKVDRQYYGIDAQASFISAIGTTTIRGEYFWGKQPGISKSSVSPKGLMTESKTVNVIVKDTLGKVNTIPVSSTVGSDVYLREFNGGYIFLIQRILQTKHELVFKYDWYDPNTKLEGDQIGASVKTKANQASGAGDIKFTTIGLGYNYYATTNLRLSVYYDMVSNEKTSHVKGKGTGTDNFSKDLKDNVLTIRALYKF